MATIINQCNFYAGALLEVMFFYCSEILGVSLPDKVVLEVKETVPGYESKCLKGCYYANWIIGEGSHVH